jgi:hypothetical protein
MALLCPVCLNSFSFPEISRQDFSPTARIKSLKNKKCAKAFKKRGVLPGSS